MPNKDEVFSNEYGNLNKEQKEAVDSIYGPIMVVAGPGTGKTQIMALRAANIILKTGTDPRNILITTFTEAGIVSLKKRLFDFIGSDSYKINVCTIHSFCNDVILAFPEKFLEYRALRPIDEIEQIELLESIIDSGNYEALSSQYDKYFYLKDIKGSISKLKQEGIDPQEFGIIIQKLSEDYEEILASIDPKLKKYGIEKEKQEKHISKLRELNDIYENYLTSFTQKGVYDFSDMIDYVLRKMKSDDNLRLHYSMQYQFIMIDEYQDTNNAQNEIIDLMLSESDDKNIMVVGDDDQSIYRFQGANLENMLYFSKKYEDTKFVVLKENYRSVQGILDLSSESIQNNSSRITNFIPGINKVLNSNKSMDSQIRLGNALNDVEEKAFILEEINRLLDSGEQIEEIAIITRTNGELESFTDFLQSNGMPVESKLKSNILKSRFVRLLLDMVSVIFNPFGDDTKLANLLRSDISGVDKLDILIILKRLSTMNFKLTQKKKLFELLSDSDYLDSISKEPELQQKMFTDEKIEEKLELKLTQKERIDSFVAKLLDCQSELSNNFYTFFKSILERFGFVEFVTEKGNFSDIEDIYTLLGYVKGLVESDRELSPEKFLKKINYFYRYSLSISRNILKGSVEGVQVMTAHNSKGLEFGTVFIPGLNYGNWGSRRNPERIKLPFGIIGSSITEELGDEKDKLNEEERRLFFVAMTRAKKNLILTFPNGENSKPKLPSEFLQEISLKPKVIENINIGDIVMNSFKTISFDNLVSKEEELYIKEFLKNYKLSASDLNKFLEDPRIFLRDSIFKYPFEDNEFTIFGKVYHKTLEYFYLDFKKTGTPQDKEYLKRTFMAQLNKEILTAEEFERLKEKGTQGLCGWYDNQSEFILPIELEYDFRFRNVYLDGIPLTGKIDKIEQGINNEVSLIDYKTGKIKTLNEILGKTQSGDGKYFRQILFYKLMFDIDTNLNAKYDATKLAIEFVEGKDGKYPTIDILFTQEDLDNLKEEIKEVRSKINDLEFWKSLL